MSSFQAKIGWKMQRKIETKKCRSVSFLLDALQKIQKKQLKISKTLLWLHFMQNQVGKGTEREKIKIVVPFCSHSTQNRKFLKNSKKIKKLKNTFMASFHAKTGLKILRNRENKNYRSVSFLPDA